MLKSILAFFGIPLFIVFMMVLYQVGSFFAGKICPPIKIDEENNRKKNEVAHQFMTYFLIMSGTVLLWLAKPSWWAIQGAILELLVFSFVAWVLGLILFGIIRKKKPNSLRYLFIPSYFLLSIAILLIISSVKFPNRHKSKLSAAKSNLYHIYTLQETYYSENFRYLNLEEMGNLGQDRETICDNNSSLGFKLDGCHKVRFAYSAKTSEDGKSFIATAIAYPGSFHPYGPKCETELRMTINQNKEFKIENLEEVREHCTSSGWLVH